MWEHSLSRALMLFWENNEFIVWRAFVGVCLNVLVVVSGQDIWVGNSIWKHSVDGTQSYGDAKIAQWELIKHKETVECGPWGEVTFRGIRRKSISKSWLRATGRRGDCVNGPWEEFQEGESGQRSGKSRRSHGEATAKVSEMSTWVWQLGR